MLYKQIHLSAIYDSCSRDDLDYALSIDTYILEEDKRPNLFIELDSIFKHATIDDIETRGLVGIRV